MKNPLTKLAAVIAVVSSIACGYFLSGAIYEADRVDQILSGSASVSSAALAWIAASYFIKETSEKQWLPVCALSAIGNALLGAAASDSIAWQVIHWVAVTVLTLIGTAIFLRHKEYYLALTRKTTDTVRNFLLPPQKNGNQTEGVYWTLGTGIILIVLMLGLAQLAPSTTEASTPVVQPEPSSNGASITVVETDTAVEQDCSAVGGSYWDRSTESCVCPEGMQIAHSPSTGQAKCMPQQVVSPRG